MKYPEIWLGNPVWDRSRSFSVAICLLSLSQAVNLPSRVSDCSDSPNQKPSLALFALVASRVCLGPDPGVWCIHKGMGNMFRSKCYFLNVFTSWDISTCAQMWEPGCLKVRWEWKKQSGLSICTATKGAIPNKAQGVSKARSVPLLCDCAGFQGSVAPVRFHETVKPFSDQSEDSRPCIFSLVWLPFIFLSLIVLQMLCVL